jgi:hypothetical protein
LTSKQHFTIDFVFADGKPLEPNSVANAFTTQCGVLVRDMVLISIQEWNNPKATKRERAEGEPEEGAGVSYVSKIVQDRLWESLLPHFTLPATKDLKLAELTKQKVSEWAHKKIAAQFNNHKKILWNAYIKPGRKAPEFTTPNENPRDHWDSFVEYKESELGKLRTAKNKKML